MRNQISKEHFVLTTFKKYIVFKHWIKKKVGSIAMHFIYFDLFLRGFITRLTDRNPEKILKILGIHV